VLVGRGVVKTEEVEQIDEIGDTPRGKAALTNFASQRQARGRWAAGVHAALHNNDGAHGPRKIDSPHGRLADRDFEVAHKAAAKVGIKPHEVPSHNYDYDKKGGYGTKVADPAHKLADRNKPKMEEVEIDETAGAKLRKVVPGLGKFVAGQRAASARDRARGGGSISDDPSKRSQDDKLRVADHRRAKKYEKIANEEVEQIDEVDYPKNQADMLAHIMHQIKVTGHPVATDAQFRATHGKDTTKKASLEPGQDKLQYTIAQGGNVKP
jgi:hypothetical protein